MPPRDEKNRSSAITFVSLIWLKEWGAGAMENGRYSKWPPPSATAKPLFPTKSFFFHKTHCILAGLHLWHYWNKITRQQTHLRQRKIIGKLRQLVTLANLPEYSMLVGINQPGVDDVPGENFSRSQTHSLAEKSLVSWDMLPSSLSYIKT